MKKLLIPLLILFMGCKVLQKAQAPAHDPISVSMAVNIKSKVDTLYSSIINFTDKNFTTYRSFYRDIDDDISTLKSYDASRQNASAVLRIVSDIQTRFSNYESEHQNYGSINNSQALAYKQGMDRLLKILIRTENHYK